MSSPAPVSSAYLHIPFCQVICSYCDFVSYAGAGPEKITAYVVALQREIELAYAYYKEHRPQFIAPLQTVFFGGGTPSHIPAGQLALILNTLERTFGLASQCECTIEANPGTIQAEALEVYLAAGINRLSIGLQAGQEHLLHFLGRRHSLTDYQESVRLARQVGFSNISADLIFGVPGQTLADLAQTADAVLQTGLEHVSYYGLILEEGTPLQREYAKKAFELPSDEAERDHYHLLRQLFDQAGLGQYEISSSARPGYQCRHNLTYWQALPYYGFGLAAHSYVDSIRSGNTRDLASYLAAYQARADGPLPAAPTYEQARPVAQTSEVITEDEAMREVMLLGLRLTAGISDLDFTARFKKSMFQVFAREIDLLRSQQLVSQSGDRISLTEKGLDLANQAFMLFVG